MGRAGTGTARIRCKGMKGWGVLAARHGRVVEDHTVGTLTRYLDGMGFHVPPDRTEKKRNKRT